MKTDLHIHSYYSDGEHSPKYVLSKIKESGISLFSVVDHNYISPKVQDIKRDAKAINVYFVDGIEISCIDKKRNISIHMLGYSKKFNLEINSALKPVIDGYNIRAKKIIEKINRELPGINLNFEEIYNKHHEQYITRNTLARLVCLFLKQKITIKDALKQYVFVEEDDSWMFNPKTVIDLIRKNGGIVVIAHSGRIYERLGSENYENFISELVLCGLQGIEVYYPSHTPEQINTLEKLAKKYNLVITGGSDWHGATYTPNTKLGSLLPETESRNFLRFISAL